MWQALRFTAFFFFLAFSQSGLAAVVEDVCPNELIKVGEALLARRGAPSTGETPSSLRTSAVASATMAGPVVDRETIAREAALFLVNTAYVGVTQNDTGVLRTPPTQMLLHRNRLRVLLGNDQRVPLHFLTDLEARSRRTILVGRALEEQLWELERTQQKEDPSFQPETVRQVVTVISKVLERKEVKPLTDFVLEHYQDALSILGVSNEVDDLRWKIIALVMQEKIDQDAPSEEMPQTFQAKAKARFFAIVRAAHNLVRRVPSWQTVSKEVLMALAASDHQPLDSRTIAQLTRLSYAFRDTSRRSTFTVHLNALISLEHDLAEVLTSYFRNYRAAVLLKKLLHDVACTDQERPLESYNLARQAMQWRLNDHPYVRHVVENGLVGNAEIYHPYLCVPLAVGRPISELEDPLLAAQALSQPILSALYEESRPVGLEAMVREWNVKAADRTLAEVEGILKKSAASAGANLLTRVVAKDPKYEELIGAALGPIVERLKKTGTGSVASSEKPKSGWADDPTEKEGKDKDPKKKKKDEDPLDPWFEAEEEGGSRRRDKQPASEPLDTEPIAFLLVQIQNYLGEESTKIDWSKVRAVPRANDKEKKNEGEAEKKADAWDSETEGSSSASKRRQQADFSVAYSWVDAVYELLNQRAEKVRDTDLEIEAKVETAKLGGDNATLYTTERVTAAQERQRLISTFLNVQHAIKACIMGQQAIRNRDANDDEISIDALRVAAFFLEKHRSLARFLSSHSHFDPSLRELWVRMFVHVASGHMDLNPRSPFPAPFVPVSVQSPMRRWLKIAGYSCAIVAVSIGGSMVLSLKGCAPEKPAVIQKAEPGGAEKAKPTVETPAGKETPPKPPRDPWDGENEFAK